MTGRVYTELLPGPGELSATMMIEIEDKLEDLRAG
jgi:hypothetical protein